MRNLRDVKVTPKAAAKIRELRRAGLTVPQLAQRFGVGKSLVVSRIVNGSWSRA